MLNKLINHLFQGKPKSWIVGVGIAFVLFIGYLDYLVGANIALSIIYLIPVALVAWFVGRWSAFFIAFLSTVTWFFFTEILHGALSGQILIAVWNSIARFIIFSIAAYLLSYLRGQRLYLEETVQKQTKALLDVQKRLSESEKLALLGQLSAGVIHEINNPLFGVYSRLELIESGELTTEQRKSLGMAMQGIDMIKVITTNLLDIAMANKLELSSVNIIKIINEVVALLKPHFDQAKIAVDFISKDKIFIIQADKDKMKQVFMNILLNSIEAISDNGKIDLRVRLEGENIVITVTDNGRGIEPERIPHIFEPFGSWEKTNREKGVGLGLFVVSNIISAHKGGIKAESTLGQETTFSITLPKELENDAQDFSG
ncbi:MAG: ATP-binding protein [Planctomycetota bacterium]